jgi:DNA-binding response OmpR family regulator
MTLAASVLIIDDDTDFLASMQGLLTPLGFHVLTASDGSAALAVLRQHSPDVLLVDWNLPDTDGLRLIKTLRDDPLHRDCYAIMVTARSDRADMVKGMDEGANDYLAKPFNNDELLVRIRVGVRTRRLERELAEQVRRATVLEMAGSVAHEIGNPLAAAKLLQQKLATDDRLSIHADLVRDFGDLGVELRRIEDLVRKAQMVTRVHSKPYAGNIQIIDFGAEGEEPSEK